MSTPPAYTSQTTIREVEPPPYSSTPSPPRRLHQQPQQIASNNAPLMPESQPDTAAYQMTEHKNPYVDKHHRTSSSSSSTGTSKTSRWQRLKQENEERKAKMQHVTHEEAAEIMGHDEEWLEEREMGKNRENGWVKKGSGGCVVM